MDIFIGTISAFGFNYAPYGWSTCQGQILAINSNTALFALLGTAYGGNGSSTFGLPNLGARVAVSQGNNGQSTYVMGQSTGATSVTLSSGNLPAHNHTVSVAITSNSRDISNSNSPAGNYLATATEGTAGNYNPEATSNVYMKAPTMVLQSVGGNTPIGIQDPVQVLNYCIATNGYFPPRN